MNLGMAELWRARLETAERHLEQALALAQRTGRPYIAIECLGNRALLLSFRTYSHGFEVATHAVELATEHGWEDEPIVALAHAVLGMISAWRGRLEEAEGWLRRAERSLTSELEPTEGSLLHRSRGLVELACGRHDGALVIEAIARDAVPDTGASSRALERALELAEGDGLLRPFLLHRAPELLDRHRPRTAHASLVSEITSLLTGKGPMPGKPAHAREARPHCWSPARPVRSPPRRFLLRSWQIRPSRSHEERTGRRDRRHPKVPRAPGQPPSTATVAVRGGATLLLNARSREVRLPGPRRLPNRRANAAESRWRSDRWW
jgi:tetratricopeptide (TPR) repeat protein